MTRTLEQIIKFDSGLSVGRSPVTIQRRDGSMYSVIVEISTKGSVYILPKPERSDMYTGWYRVKGDEVKLHGGVIVWGARDPELLKKFNDPVTTISFPSNRRPTPPAPRNKLIQ